MFSVGSAALAGASGALPAFAQDGSKRLKKRKKAQKGSKRRSKRLFEPARCRQCARRGCSSLLRCRLCVRRGCSRLLFEITIRKCWARLHCALSHCTLLCFAPCMYMHGSTLYILHMCKSCLLTATFCGKTGGPFGGTKSTYGKLVGPLLCHCTA